MSDHQTSGVPMLDGVKVVEFAQNAAIPHCARLLAGMGADVVKVEPPSGDAMRHTTPLAPFESRVYALINPSKRAIAVDLGSPDARPVIEALFEWADVAVVAFKYSDLERYGIDWDSARAVNPRLVHLTHTPFGPEGPDRDVGGYDVLVQGRSGAGYIMNRSENGVPVSTRPAVNDFSTGIMSALGVVTALRHRDLTGEGQRVDTSLLGTALSLAIPVVHHFHDHDAERDARAAEAVQAARDAGAGFDDQRAIYERKTAANPGAFRLYFRHYETSDGMISVGGLSPGLIRKFHEVTGLPRVDLSAPNTEEFAQTVAQAESLFRSNTREQWLQRLRAAGYPASPYYLPFEAIDDPQARANDYVVDIDHPVVGRYSTSGTPIRFSAAPNVELAHSPAFGEHTVEVMTEIGLDAPLIDKLLVDGVIVCPEEQA